MLFRCQSFCMSRVRVPQKVTASKKYYSFWSELLYAWNKYKKELLANMSITKQKNIAGILYRHVSFNIEDLKFVTKTIKILQYFLIKKLTLNFCPLKVLLKGPVTWFMFDRCWNRWEYKISLMYRPILCQKKERNIFFKIHLEYIYSWIFDPVWLFLEAKASEGKHKVCIEKSPDRHFSIHPRWKIDPLVVWVCSAGFVKWFWNCSVLFILNQSDQIWIKKIA